MDKHSDFSKVVILAISSTFLAAILGVALVFSIRQNHTAHPKSNDSTVKVQVKTNDLLFDPALQKLAKGYAHDVNNLIAVVLLNAERLANILSDDEHVDSVEQIIQACESGRFLNHQIQAIGGNQLVHKNETDVGTLINNNRQRFENLIDNDNWLIIRIEEKMMAMIDQELILTAIDCLIKNAANASAKSEIWIIGKREQEDECHSIMISVANDGVFSADVDPSKIFEPYYTSKNKNRGLGLTFAGSIVANHDGTMRVSSKDGKTVISMIIPA